MSQKGFTLVELLVTIAIIGILSSLAIVSFGNTAKQEKVRASGEVLKEFLRNTQLLSHKEGKKLGLKFSSSSLVLYADSLCVGTEILDEEVLDNNTQIAGTPTPPSVTGVTFSTNTAGNGWAGDWATGSYVSSANCLKIDPSSEGSVFPDGGSLGVIYKGATGAGPGAVVYKKSGDRRIHLQFSRDGAGWRKI